tara:strand:+ start:1385 stop:1627 length:243 start_codon:yes stop_codon:yes gene_type:complete
MTNQIEIASTKKAVQQMIDTKAEMEAMIQQMEIMVEPEAPFEIEADREKVKEMLARTQNDLVNINKEIAHWQDWLEEHDK